MRFKQHFFRLHKIHTTTIRFTTPKPLKIRQVFCKLVKKLLIIIILLNISPYTGFQ